MCVISSRNANNEEVSIGWAQARNQLGSPAGSEEFSERDPNFLYNVQ